MSEVPLHIECVDISHLGGTNVVGSLVRFEDGLPAKSGYRHYRITDTTDDTASIHQLVLRRFGKFIVDSPDPEAQRDLERQFPQLLIVDGGLPQVNAAQRALDELGIQRVAVCGIAKRLEEIWRPHDDHPLILPRSSESLFLVQRMRDEAHRFAITFQRKQRSQSIQTELSSIPGLGEKRIKALLQAFRSVKRLRAASVEEIESVSGISEHLAITIYEHLNSPKAPET
jgi:excinuclease ABC subunit C